MQTESQLRAKLTGFERSCRASGLPVTHQRRVILAALVKRCDHPTADMVYEAVKESLPGVSRTTVYRVLDLLVRLQAAIRINSPSAQVRYDAEVRPHHHAICQRCETVVDLRAPEFDDISLPREFIAGFSCNGYSVNFSGICQACNNG